VQGLFHSVILTSCFPFHWASSPKKGLFVGLFSDHILQTDDYGSFIVIDLSADVYLAGDFLRRTLNLHSNHYS
jgi:hypothetical protein